MKSAQGSGAGSARKGLMSWLCSLSVRVCRSDRRMATIMLSVAKIIAIMSGKNIKNLNSGLTLKSYHSMLKSTL